MNQYWVHVQSIEKDSKHTCTNKYHEIHTKCKYFWRNPKEDHKHESVNKLNNWKVSIYLF